MFGTDRYAFSLQCLGRSNINTLVELSGALGYPLAYKDAKDVDREIKSQTA
jgi:hypothetical protein